MSFLLHLYFLNLQGKGKQKKSKTIRAWKYFRKEVVSMPVGENVSVFYNDTMNTVSKSVGRVMKENPNFIELKTSNGIVNIPMCKIVRIERQEERQNGISR